MQLVLIVILLFVTLALIGIILLQKSEGGANALAASQHGMGGFMSSRSAANFLTRTTAVLAAVFMGLCLLLAIISSRKPDESASLINVKPSQEASSKGSQPSS